MDKSFDYSFSEASIESKLYRIWKKLNDLERKIDSLTEKEKEIK